MRLHINIDHVATLRNQRDTPYPDPVEAALLCMDAGADGITAHLREDRRHIRDDDILALRNRLTGVLNLEMAATDGMAAVAERVRPNVVTLVPEKREERTTEGGLNVVATRSSVEHVAAICLRSDIKLSLFIEPSLEQVEESKRLGAQQVEFHTGHYADASVDERPGMIPAFEEACRRAHELGLEIAGGHGLTVDNVAPICRLPHMAELNIGHSVVSRAVLVGMGQAVSDIRAAMDAALR